VEDILSYVPQTRQTAMFSATMSPDIMRLMKKHLKNPVHIDTTDHKNEVPKIDQFYCELPETQKFDALTRIIDQRDIKAALIFVNTKSMVDRVVSRLSGAGYRARGIHGGHEQCRREMVMNSFRDGSVKILVATDVAGRGIDISDIDTVINYDLPRDDEDYTHRIGRTGRAGKLGTSFTFVVGKELYDLKRIEKNGGFNIQRMDIPGLGQKPAKTEAKHAETDRNKTAARTTRPSKGPAGETSRRQASPKNGRAGEKRQPPSHDEGWITDSTGFRYKLI